MFVAQLLAAASPRAHDTTRGGPTRTESRVVLAVLVVAFVWTVGWALIGFIALAAG